MAFIPTKGGEMLREGMKLEEKENQRVNPEKHPHFMSVLGRGAEKGLRRKSHWGRGKENQKNAVFWKLRGLIELTYS